MSLTKASAILVFTAVVSGWSLASFFHHKPEPALLPKWQDSMSDGCSFAPIASSIPAMRACCVVHDHGYYVGGSEARKNQKDSEFRDCLIAAHVPVPIADGYFEGVQVGGRPEGRIPNVSWAFGGERFVFTEQPAKEAEK